MKAGRHIDLDNSVYMGARNLTLASDAVFTTANQHTGAAGAGLPTSGNGLGNNGVGNVTLRGNHTVRTGGDVTITGVDFNVLGGSTGSQAATIQSLTGQELIASGAMNLMNSGVITVRAGVSNPTPSVSTDAPKSGSGARVQGGTVNIGSASTPATNPTLLVIEGGSNVVGVATFDPNDPAIDRNQANAAVVSSGDMNIHLRGKALTTAGSPAVPFDDIYSVIVRGGFAQANNPGATPLIVSALGKIQAQTLTMETQGTILFQGGTSHLMTTNAGAASSAQLMVQNEKTITTSNGGSVVLIGGTTNVDSTDLSRSVAITSISAPNAQAMAQLDPSKLTMTVDGILVLQGGKTTGPAGSLASARIDAGDEIKITVHGSKPYSYAGSGALGPASFYMIGGSDSGFFDSNNVDLAGSLAYPQAFPITVTLAGAFQRVFDSSLASGVVQTGLTTFDDSLLSYVIFAANVETRALRFRQGLTDGDDIGAPACR
jgi:hypothetical protein